MTLLVGVFFPVDEFTLAALECEHPFARFALPDPVVDSLRFRVSSSPQVVRDFRAAALTFWQKRAAALEVKEAALKSVMNADVRRVMENKRLLLFSEMLRSVGFPAADTLVELMSSGFPPWRALSGDCCFPSARRPAEHSIEDLWRSAPRVRSLFFSSMTSSRDLFDGSSLERPDV